MRRVMRLVLACLVVARAFARESLRVREKRRKKMVEELSDYERSMITEMHTQGLQPEHISIELGLERSGDYVRELIETLEIDKPMRRSRGRVPKKAKAKPTPRPRPAEKAAEHRERMRESKRRRRDEM